MYLLSAANSGETFFAGLGLIVLGVIVCAAIVGIAEIVASILNLIVYIRTRRANKTQNENQVDGQTVARNLLDNLGMQDVKVEKVGFFKAIFYGNHYNRKQKTIYLTRGILEGKTINAVGQAVLNVVYAEMDKNNDKGYLKKARLEPLIHTTPFLFIPIILVGLVVDLLALGQIGIVTLLFTVAALVFYLVAIIFYGVSIPVRKRAMKRALEIVGETKALNESEQTILSNLYKSVVMAEIANMILAILYFIKLLLKLLSLFMGKK